MPHRVRAESTGPAIRARRQTRLVLLGLLAGFVAGCGGGGETSSTNALIDDVGRGSEAVQSIIDSNRLLEVRARSGDFFSDDRTGRLLFQGRLHRLSERDLDATLSESRRREQVLDEVLDERQRAGNAALDARIGTAEHAELTSEEQEFVGVWNAYLAAQARRASQWRRSLGTMRFAYDNYEALVEAARDAARGQSRAVFERLRVKTARELVTNVERVRARVNELRQPLPEELRLAEFVYSNDEAQALVEKASEEYPDGFLPSSVG